jgi:hypothetical protein
MDLVEIIIFIVVVLASIAGQLFNKDKARKAPQRRPARPKPVAARPPLQPQAQAQQANRGKLEGEIEQFVRRAVQAGQQQQRTEPARRDQPLKPARRPPQKPPTPQRGEKKRTAEAESRPVVAELASKVPSLERRDSHLAEVIENRDEQMEAHLKGVFGRGLGSMAEDRGSLVPTIAPSQVAAEQSPQSSARRLFDLFRSPDEVRNAVIMSEILKRPE